MNKNAYLYIAGFAVIFPQLFLLWSGGHSAIAMIVTIMYISLSIILCSKVKEERNER